MPERKIDFMRNNCSGQLGSYFGPSLLLKKSQSAAKVF